MNLILFFLIGACFGSFSNVVIYRYPFILGLHPDKKKISFLSFPSSFCPQCKNKIPWYHNIPILSFVILMARCHACKKPIAIHYFMNEIMAASFFTYSYVFFGFGYELFLLNLFFLFSLVLFWIDFKFFILPNLFNYSLIGLGLIFNFYGGWVNLNDALIGALVGYSFLWSLYKIHHHFTQKEGMGYGDFKLLAAQGAWFGWEALPIIGTLASILGLAHFYFLLKRKQIKINEAIPFGPSIILGGMLYLFLIA